MSYRVERAVSNRAVCKATECKDANIKIDKDELRLGTWVAFEDRGSWAWRHWGCVSGKQIENLRKILVDPDQPGVYRWDYLDGYDSEDKGSLEGYPDLQEKVRRVITQGFIDPEDFNGDPEMNKLGETGLRTAESKKKVREDKKNRANEMKELEAKLAAVEAERDALLQGGGSTARLDAQVGSVKDEIEEKKTPKKKPATKKRVKNESDDDGDEAFETMPAKKKRATKAKKEEDANLIKDEDEVDAPIAAPKKRAPRKKAVKAEDNASMFKEEEGLDDQTMTTAPKKRAPRGRKAVKEEPVDEQNVNDSGEPSEVNAPVKKGRKKAVKKELSDHMAVMRGIGSAAGVTDGSSLNTTIPAEAKTSAAIKGEPSDAVNVGVGSSSVVASFGSINPGSNEETSQNAAVPAGDETFIPGIKDDDLLYEFKHASKTALDDYGDEAFEQFIEQKKAEIATSQPKKKGGRVKKAADPTAKSTRATRSNASFLA